MLAFVLAQLAVFFANVEIKKQIAPFVINILLTLLVVLSIVFVYALLGFHIFLTTTNTTTNEFCKKTWESVAGNSHQKYGMIKT